MVPNAFVIGDVCEDVWVYCKSERLSPEIPVPCVKPIRRESNPGMAGNVAQNLKAFKANVFILPLCIFSEGSNRKIRYIDESTGHNFLRVDENDGSQETLTPTKVESDLRFFDRKWSDFDLIIISDYAKGTVSKELVRFLGKKGKEFNIPTFLDTKMVLGKWADDISFIKINEKEFNYNISKSVYLKKTKNNCRLIVTRAEKGTLFQGYVYKPPVVDVVQPAGCGDTFLAAFAVSYSKTKDAVSAIKRANHFASLACSKKGVVSKF